MPGAVSLMPNVLNALEKVKEKVYVWSYFSFIKISSFINLVMSLQELK
jgi:hypothetical protein